MSSPDAILSHLTVKPIRTVAELDEKLSDPGADVVDFMKKLEGDILILGVSGKVGPGLARMAAQAMKASGKPRRILGVASFRNEDNRREIESFGVETIKADLYQDGVFDLLPDCPNVLYLIGRKFGSTGSEWLTWMTNVFLAGQAARRYAKSRIVAFSSGNVYPFMPIASGGATESTLPGPIGEYAASCLGRERMFDHFSNETGTKVLHYRLNYAVELRYGILYDVATRVWNGLPVSLTMGHVNVVWQGYVNRVALLSLGLAASPPRILNVTGPETVSIRQLATRFGELFNKSPIFEGTEAPEALLSNATDCFKHFGRPEVTLDTLIEWTAYWVASGGPSLGKPTHFEARDGKF